MKTKFIITIALVMFIFCSNKSLAQTQKVRDYLKMVAMGKVSEVKKQIPDLIAEYPNDPGVQLLLAVVIDDAFLAVEKYKNLVKTYPESEWADDAYWRIVQFYAVIGDTSTAKTELENYRKKYPASEFLIAATDVVRYSINYAKSDKNPRNAVQSSVSKDIKPLEQETKPKQEAVKKEITTSQVKSETITKHEPVKKEIPQVNDTKPKQEQVKKLEVKSEEIKAKQETVKKENIPTQPKTQTVTKQEPAKKDENKPKIEIAKKEEVKPKQEIKKEVASEITDNEKFGLQVGVYSTKEAADGEVAKFKQQRLISYVMNKEIDGTQMFAVVVGEYSSKESAEQARKIVQVQCKCQPIIFKK
ncbi:MAG: SPOR domain-containing protein [Ignavibacteriae bacterium]|nr:SPOR domain-containing protein [Ignavibacteriota bacterium]